MSSSSRPFEHKISTRPRVYAPGRDLRWPSSAVWRPGEPAIRIIGVDDLKDAVRRGIEDFKAMPSHALFLVIVYPVIGILLGRVLFGYGAVQLAFPLLAGFALLGPFAALGLYELSRRREKGLDASAWHALKVYRGPGIGPILTLGIILLALFGLWLAIAQALYTQNFGERPFTGLREFVGAVLTTSEGLRMAVIGNAVGFVFAVIAFALSAISFPLMLDRKVGLATAVRTSIRAVVENPLVMMLWGAFIAATLLIGALPALLGLALVLPILGHATWHLYRRIVVFENGDRRR